MPRCWWARTCARSSRWPTIACGEAALERGARISVVNPRRFDVEL
ncbi:MAG: hypothetical protein U5K43_00605 [Halofilum sp. (in: g-proteobacteria)]|nr:hypothetical protein [Halofilum sp. (in: g-proteobacteria)]